MTSKNEDRLCENCSLLDFQSYFQDAKHSRLDHRGLPGAVPEAVSLGTFEEVFAKCSRCHFCDIVVDAICTFRSWNLATPEQIITWSRSTRDPMKLWLYSYCYAFDSLRNEQRRAYRIGISKRVGDEDHQVSGDHIGDIQLFFGDALRISGASLFYGRLVDSGGLNMDLARHWIRECEGNHMDLCAPQDGLNELLYQVRVIDVRNRCICPMPRNVRYLALSYCWPVGETFRLLQANLTDLQKTGSLTERMNELPMTIRDAINFVDKLGETYLWVDALCIIQDDEGDKEVQLAQMGRIYGSALATLACVPATQDPVKACSGLPCYRDRSRSRIQKAVRVKDLCLIVPFEAVISLQTLSRWSQRAWTYQEMLLSKRLFFFTDTQVYFQCSIGVFCEDSLGVGVRMHAHVCPVANLWNPGSPYINQDTEFAIDSLHMNSSSAHPARIINNYAQHIDNYTLRDMSLPGDILNAFTGIQNAMEKTMCSSFLQGIPLRYIDKCLLWTLVGPYKQRSTGPSSPKDTCFPSWSWAGWFGPTSMVSYLNITRARSEVVWYLVEKTGELIRLKVDDFPGMEAFPEPGNKAVGTLSSKEADRLTARWLEVEMRKNLIRSNLNSLFRLACWSSSAKFRIDGRTASLDSHGLLWKHASNLMVLDEENRWVGSTMIDNELEKRLLQQEPPGVLEFMLISRSVSVDLPSYPNVEFFDIKYLPKRKWCMLNVMAFERCSTGTIVRLAIGVVHEDAWVRACAAPEFFKLE